ncbi:MAG: hypothetical protein GY808_15845 [Gammaproteobacteria bacterium]|nr:hypothetical protein [Gammaproteobacteria bacterium]
MTTLAIGQDISFLESPKETGSSQALKDLIDFKRKLFLDEVSPSVLHSKHFILKEELAEMFDECSTDDWDGYGALPLKKEALFEAERFIDALPIWLTSPELAPEPNGDIGFQWSFGKHKILAISFSGENVITFASILGSQKRTRYGTEIFNDSIPKEIIKLLGQIRSSV